MQRVTWNEVAEKAKQERQDKLIEIWSLVPDIEPYFKGLNINEKRTLAQLLSNQSSYMARLSQNHMNELKTSLSVDSPTEILHKVCATYINDYLPNVNVIAQEVPKEFVTLKEDLVYNPQPNRIDITKGLKDVLRIALADEEETSEEKDFYFIIYVPFIVFGEVKSWYKDYWPPVAVFGDIKYA